MRLLVFCKNLPTTYRLKAIYSVFITIDLKNPAPKWIH